MIEQKQFQGSAESKGFKPVEQTSYIPLLEKQHENYRRDAAIVGTSIANNGRIKEAEAESNWRALAGFSETLQKQISDHIDKKNAADEEEGLMLAFTEGVPEEQMKSLDEQEAQLIKSDAQARNIAGTVEAEGSGPFVGQMFRELSGWKAYGYVRGLAMKGGANYPIYYAQAAANASVIINGQEVTLNTASNPAERAAVEAEIRRGYLRQYLGINPALLNKYLFPQMLAHENQQAIEWNDRQTKILQETRKAEAQDELYTGINAGRGGETVLNFINRYAGDFGGIGNARRVAREMLEEGVKTRAFDRGEIDAILNYEFTSRDGRKVRLGDYWGRDFGHLPDLLYEAGRVDLQRELQAQDDAKSQFKLLFDEQLASGQPISEADLKAIEDSWKAQGLGEAPDWLKNYRTREDIADDVAKKSLMELRQSRGYLTEEDLRGVSPELYSQMIGYVKEDADLAMPSEEMSKDANKEIEARVSAKTTEIDGTKEKSVTWHRIRMDAIDGFARYYRENMRQGGMTPEQAYEAAMQRVQANLDKGSYGQPLKATVDQQARAALQTARAAIAANANIVNTAVIPGTESALQQARDYRDGKATELPLLYRQLAEHHRGLTAWDIANAQLAAAGEPPLLKPQVEQAVDTMDPRIRALLQWRPTAARSNRAAIQMGWKSFLDLIASKESEAYGGYDAMNTGGAAGGTVAYGSANSTDVFGRGLSTMTIREVITLGNQGKIHAAGRYQFINSTLKEVMNKGGYTQIHGLTLDSPFNAASQDRLAVALAQNTIAASTNKLSSLRGTWIGLQKVPDAILQSAVSRLTSDSPFNQAENLHPRLVYRIGSRGYGSTGPHLDVKPVPAGGTTASRNLPAMTKTLLDKYVVVGQNQQPLSQGTVTTDDHAAHVARGSYGWDYAADDGTPVYLKNGAKVVGSFKGDGGTDHLIVELPDGRRFQFLHGLKA